MTSRPLHRPGDSEPRGVWPPPSATPEPDQPAEAEPGWGDVVAAALALAVIVAAALAFTAAAVWQVVG